MNCDDYIRSVHGTKPSYTSENSNETSSGYILSPAAKEAREVIPQGIVAKRTALYGRQVNRSKTPEDNTARLTTSYQDTMDQSNSAKNQIKNIFSFLDRNRITNRTSYADLPQEIKALIFSYLGVKTLNAISEVSTEENTVVKSNYLQYKLLLDFALNTALLLPDPKLKANALYNIAAEQTMNDNIEGAKVILASVKDAALLLTNCYATCEILQKVAIAQAKNNDLEGAKKTFTLAKKTAFLIKSADISGYSMLLKRIATAQAESGDMKKAGTTFILAREAALLIKNDSNKYKVLEKIAMQQAQNGDISGAKETSYFLNNRADVLKEIAIAQTESGDIKEAENTVSQIENRYEKLNTLFIIAEALHKNGDIDEAKKILALAKNIALLEKSEYSKSILLKRVATKQAKNGDRDGAKETLALAKNIALLEENMLNRCIPLRCIAEALAKIGDVDGARETFALSKNMAIRIEDKIPKSALYRSILLQDIFEALAKIDNVDAAIDNVDAAIDDTDEAEKTFVLLNEEGETSIFSKNMVLVIKNKIYKSLLLGDIAEALHKNGDIDEAKETLALAKNTALVIEKNNQKFKTLCNIAINQAKMGDLDKAQETLELLEEMISLLEGKEGYFLLKKFSTILVKIGNVEKAKKGLISLKNKAFQLESLKLDKCKRLDFSISIAKEQAQIGDIIGAKDTLRLIENNPIVSSSSSASSDSSDPSSSSNSASSDSSDSSSSSSDLENDVNIPENELSPEYFDIIKESLSNAFYKIVKIQIQRGDIIGAKETIADMKKKGYVHNLIDAVLKVACAVRTAK